MHDLEQLQDFVSAGLVIIVISIVLTFSWLSTFVRDQPLIATTVVVLQQETETMNEQRESNDRPRQSDQLDINLQASKNTDAGICGEQPVFNSDTLSAALNHPEFLEDETNIDSGNISSGEVMSESVGLVSSAEKLVRHRPDDIEVTLDSSPIIEHDASLDRSLLNITDSGIENPIFLKRRTLKKGTGDEDDSPKIKHAGDAFDSVEIPVENKDNCNAIGLSSEKFTNNAESIPPGIIRIRLKFLDDTQRLVRGQLSELVGNFKRTNFEIELSTNCAVRLIFNGKLLNKDSSTLDQYGLFDNCVVHCYVGQPQPHATDETSSNNTNSESEDIDLSEILSPLLLIVVVLLWYLRYEYSHIFNTSATVILVCLTALLLISQYALTITFNISMAFNNSVIGNHHSGNSDDSPPSSSSSSQGSSDGERELDESPNTVAAGIEQLNLESPYQPCGNSDLNSTSSSYKLNLNLHDSKLQKQKISDNSPKNSFVNSNMVSVS